jgi:hypothetical protein
MEQQLEERTSVIVQEPSFRRREPLENLPAEATPMSMLQIAVQKGMDAATIKDLLALQKEYEANEARKAFNEAMAEAKSEIPVIHKNKEVDFTSSKGRTNYRYEDLAEIARTVDPILAKHGLSYRFRTSSNVNEPVMVTCIIAHRLGHSEENTLAAGKDDSGNKNSIQAIGSTLTYLQRMTLKASLGLSASTDDDGRGADDSARLPQAECDAFIKRIKESTTKAAAKAVWQEGVNACEKVGDLDSAKALKAELLAQGKFIDEAAKAK